MKSSFDWNEIIIKELTESYQKMRLSLAPGSCELYPLILFIKVRKFNGRSIANKDSARHWKKYQRFEKKNLFRFINFCALVEMDLFKM